MDDLTDDHLFLDAVDAIALDALAIIGDNPRARYALFKGFLAVAQEATGESAKLQGTSADLDHVGADPNELPVGQDEHGRIIVLCGPTAQRSKALLSRHSRPVSL